MPNSGVPKKLINSPESAVTDALEGLLLAQPHLGRLDGFPDIKVVFNRHHDKEKVAVISGGGSGHEPAHAGYVGDGMLAAAVCGDVFASPSAESVLAAIRTVTGPAGCLLVIKNYTGDRLHFGLAAEQALAQGLRVEMVVVGEDVAVEQPSIAGRRGLAGTVLVHKAAGAAAAAGASLEYVANVARRIANSMATLGVCLSVCTIPGKPVSARLAPGEIEIGLGIHGEHGHSKAPMMPVKRIVERVLEQIVSGSFFSAPPGTRVALVVNNLGSTPPLEMLVVAREAARHCLSELRLSLERMYVGHYMTSLDMLGFSLTLLNLEHATSADSGAPSSAMTVRPSVAGQIQSLGSIGSVGSFGSPPASGGGLSPASSGTLAGAAAAAAAYAIADQRASSSASAAAGAAQQPAIAVSIDELLRLLDTPVGAPGWLAGMVSRDVGGAAAAASAPEAVPGRRSSDTLAPGPATTEAGRLLGLALRKIAEALLESASYLDEVDAKVGDGDCGATLARGSQALLRELEASNYSLDDPVATAFQLARTIRSSMGGTSGAIYDIMVTAAARRLKEGGCKQASQWANALSAGLAAVMKYGNASPGCRTMLDALVPAAHALRANCLRGATSQQLAAAAAKAAAEGAESTCSMLAAAGRASYVPVEVLREVPDPGAKAAAIWLQAVADAFV